MKIKLVASIFDYLRTINSLPLSGEGLEPAPYLIRGWGLNLKKLINLTKYSPPSQPSPFMGKELEFKYLIKKRMKINLFESIFSFPSSNPLPLRRGRAKVGVKACVGADMSIAPQHPHPNLHPLRVKEREFKYLITKRIKINLFVLIFNFSSSHHPLPLRRGRARVGVKACVGADMSIAPQHPHPNLPPFRGKQYLLSHQSGKP